MSTAKDGWSVSDIIDSILALKDTGPEFPNIPRQDRPTPFDDPAFYEDEEDEQNNGNGQLPKKENLPFIGLHP